MKTKILYIASTFIHIKHFHIPYLEELVRQGFDVEVVACGDPSLVPSGCKTHCVSFQKEMLSLKNIKTAFEIAKIIESQGIDIIYVHTSLAAFFTRLGVFLTKRKPKLVINMVHGYLFDNRSSFLKRSIMLLAEKITKPMTNVIMVMNQEDYEIAKRNNLCKGNVHFVDGIGVDFSRFPSKLSKEVIAIRNSYGFDDSQFLLVYAAEFSKRKNQQFLIRAVAKLREDGCSVKLLLLGDGALMNNCKQQVKELHLQSEVIFVGYTPETSMYYQMSDACVSSSRSEGLPFNIMEAMASGLPIVATRVKGHTDLVEHGENGFLFEIDSLEQCVSQIKLLHDNSELRTKMGKANAARSSKYSIENIKPQIIEIIKKEYESVVGGCQRNRK